MSFGKALPVEPRVRNRFYLPQPLDARRRPELKAQSLTPRPADALSNRAARAPAQIKLGHVPTGRPSDSQQAEPRSLKGTGAYRDKNRMQAERAGLHLEIRHRLFESMGWPHWFTEGQRARSPLHPGDHTPSVRAQGVSIPGTHGDPGERGPPPLFQEHLGMGAVMSRPPIKNGKGAHYLASHLRAASVMMEAPTSSTASSGLNRG